jgi:microcystin-dependent protein
MARTRFTVKEGIAVADDNVVGGYPLIPVGGLMPYAGATSPEGWLLCDGTAINRTTYANLFALIGTTYGSGNGTTTFNVPDMRSRMPIGAGAGTGLTSRALAATGGAESVVIASGNLPTHTHSIAHDHANVTSTGQSVGHTHSIDPPNTTSGNDSPGHTHSIDPPNTTSGNASVAHYHGSIGYHYHGTTGTGGSHEHRMYSVVDAASGTAKARVSSTGTSLGAYGISEYVSGHDHGTNGAAAYNTSDAGAEHTHSTDIAAFTSGGRSDYHQHDTNIAAFDSLGASVGHTHDVDLPNFTGDSGNGGFANTALAIMNPFLSVNYIIKY